MGDRSWPDSHTRGVPPLAWTTSSILIIQVREMSDIDRCGTLPKAFGGALP